MENTTKKAPWGVVWALLALFLLLALLANRYTVRQIWCNLTSPTLKLDESADWAGGASYERVPYASDSEAQYFDLYVPDTAERAPLLVLVHGGGFAFNDSQSRQAQFMYRYFRDHGFACASVNYRLSGEAPYPAACEDVKAAVRFLAHNADSYGYDAQRIAIWGESAGGYLACMTALSAPDAYCDTLCLGETAENRFPMPAFDALVDYYGCEDFESLRTQFEEEGLLPWVPKLANSWANEVLRDYDSLEEYWLRVPHSDWGERELVEASVLRRAERQENENPRLRTLIVHGDADITVSQLQSLTLFSVLRAQGADVQLRLVPRCKHADDRLFTDEMLAETADFLWKSAAA